MNEISWSLFYFFSKVAGFDATFFLGVHEGTRQGLLHNWNSGGNFSGHCGLVTFLPSWPKNIISTSRQLTVCVQKATVTAAWVLPPRIRWPTSTEATPNGSALCPSVHTDRGLPLEYGHPRENSSQATVLDNQIASCPRLCGRELYISSTLRQTRLTAQAA